MPDITLEMKLGGDQHLLPHTREAADAISMNAKQGDVFHVKTSFKRKEARSLSANSLFHIWCRDAAKHFKLREQSGVSPEEQMKMVFKEMFLGRQYIKVRNIEIKNQLRPTSKLDRGEMTHFMDQIQAWCASKGCALSMPQDSEYSKWCLDQTA